MVGVGCGIAAHIGVSIRGLRIELRPTPHFPVHVTTSIRRKKRNMMDNHHDRGLVGGTKHSRVVYLLDAGSRNRTLASVRHSIRRVSGGPDAMARGICTQPQG
ncbi:hypothetical protein T265_10215 [Opisthorchis viverrini]|uniref:Uncharacterized protein n=1 Tax=Opisthorchis viverrini TaxID=6198 RepID=A0A074ZE22_OPIVI|nr:hypothetical protein T265_10215 [Opisthorchis viverrini]KER21450.1 hypothetical protein T265_10215 [Opisthorchis viverrini]